MEVLTGVSVKGGPSTPKKGEKIVYFVRHGQSTANLRRQEDPSDSSTNILYKDAALTPKGVSQARAIEQYTKLWGIELLVSSPLTRAIMTACNAFEFSAHSDVPYIALPQVMEFFPGLVENLGRTTDELKNDVKLNELKRFKDMDHTLITENWWECCGDSSRIEQFSVFLRHRKEDIIAVVSHWGFIHNLINEWGFGSVSMENCDWVRTVWKVSKPKIPKHILELSPKLQPRHYALFLMPAGNHNENALLGEILSMNRNMLTKPDTLGKSSTLKYGNVFHCALTEFLKIDSRNLDIISTALKSIRDQKTFAENNLNKTCESGLQHPNIMIVDADPVFLCSRGTGQLDMRIRYKSKFMQSFCKEFTALLKNNKEGEQQEIKTFVDSFNLSCNKGELEIKLIDCVDPSIHSDLLFTLLSKKPILHGAMDKFPNYGWDYLFRILTWRVCVVSCIYDGTALVPWTFQEEHPYSFPLF